MNGHNLPTPPWEIRYTYTLERNISRLCSNARLLDAENCISYHYLDTEEFSGEEILVDYDQDVVEQVTTKLMIEKLRSVLPLLTDDEQALIQAIYFDEMSERDYAKKTGVYRNAIHKKKVRILEKSKKILEN